MDNDSVWQSTKVNLTVQSSINATDSSESGAHGARSLATSPSIVSALVVEGHLTTTRPSLSTKNFSKFHCGQNSESMRRSLRPRAKSRRTLIMEIPSQDFWALRYLYTSLVSDPLTSDFFISGNVTPGRPRLPRQLTPRGYGCGWLTKVLRAEGGNLFVRPRFLPTELVAREAQNDESLVFVLLVQGLQALVLGCETAG
jgi:hypothetical protein